MELIGKGVNQSGFKRVEDNPKYNVFVKVDEVRDIYGLRKVNDASCLLLNGKEIR